MSSEESMKNLREDPMARKAVGIEAERTAAAFSEVGASSQEMFTRTSSSNAEVLQLQIALRALRRHWLIICSMAFLLPAAMFVYDHVLNQPYIPEWMPKGAERIYSTNTNILQAAKGITTDWRVIPIENVNLDDMGSMFSGRRFKEKLFELLQGKVDAAKLVAKGEGEGVPAWVAPVEKYIKSGGASPSAQFGARRVGARGLSVSISGPDTGLLKTVSQVITAAINENVREMRLRNFDTFLNECLTARKKNEEALDITWRNLQELNRKLSSDGSQARPGFLVLDELHKQRHVLDMARQGLQIELEHIKKRVDYSLLAARYYIAEPQDISKVIAADSELHQEWSRLGDELAKLRVVYTEQHPKLQQIKENISAIRQALVKDGYVTSMGKLPDIPTRADRDALKKIETLADQIELHDRQIHVLDVRIKRAESEERAKEGGGDAAIDDKMMRRRNELRTEATYLQAKSSTLNKKAIELELAKRQIMQRDEFELQSSGGVRLVKPRLMVDVFLAFGVGLVLGILVTFLFEHVDNCFHTPTDVFYHLRLNYLGVVPYWKSSETCMIDPERPTSIIAEVYGHLCNNIRYARCENPEKGLLVASAAQGEGKSTVSVNLAVRHALEGYSVILLDADMRRPRGAKILQMVSDDGPLCGLSDYLEGNATLEDIIHPTTMPGLSLIPAGSKTLNPGKLLASKRLKMLLDELDGKSDVTIVDCPAVLPVADATAIAPYMKAVILVVSAEEVEIGAARMALYRLLHVGAPMIGSVLNKVRERGASYAYYGSRYYTYGRDDDDSAYR